MKIQLDKNHFLNGDEYCYWITTKIKSNKGKEYERRVTGYATKLEDVFTDYIDKKIKSTNATNIKELATIVEETKADIKKFLNSLGGALK